MRLKRVGEDEGTGLELQIFALGLFEIDGPASNKFPEEKQYALAVLKARPKGRQYEWWTESVVFPYSPASYVAPEKPVGDSHSEGRASRIECCGADLHTR